MDLISKIKLVFDTTTSFFQVLGFIIEYVKKYFDKGLKPISTLRVIKSNARKHKKRVNRPKKIIALLAGSSDIAKFI